MGSRPHIRLAAGPLAACLALCGGAVARGQPYACPRAASLTAGDLAGAVALEGDDLHRGARASCDAPLGRDEYAGLTWGPLGTPAWSYAPGHCDLVAACVALDGPLDAHVTTGFHDEARLTVWLGDSLVYRGLGGNAVPPVARAYPHASDEQMRNRFPVRFPAAGTYRLVLAYANPAGETIHATNTAPAIRLELAEATLRRRDVFLATAGGLAGGLLMLFGFQVSRLAMARSPVDVAFAALLATMALFVTFDTGLLQAMLRRAVVPGYLVYPLGGAGLAALALFTRAVFAEVAPRRTVGRLLAAVAIVLLVVGMLPLLGYGALEVGLTDRLDVAQAFPAVFRAGVSVGLVAFLAAVGYEVYATRQPSLYILAVGLVVLALFVLANVTQAVLEPYGKTSPALAGYLAAIRPVFGYLIPAGILLMCLSFAMAVALLGRDREVQRDRDFHLRLAEMEMRALRAQMNPHFLFNGLNSIKSFVIDNDRDRAADYLSKFARLIRLVLDNSSLSLVPLTRELEALRLYLELERERLGRSFDFEIAVADGVDAGTLLIPPTVIQPYAENAVWHGLRHRRAPGGHLRIAVEPDGENAIRIVIEDNGIGRAAAREISSRRRPGHRSRGLAITDERLTLLRELHGVEMTTTVEDLFDGAGAAGTRVVITVERIGEVARTERRQGVSE